LAFAFFSFSSEPHIGYMPAMACASVSSNGPTEGFGPHIRHEGSFFSADRFEAAYGNTQIGQSETASTIAIITGSPEQEGESLLPSYRSQNEHQARSQSRIFSIS
jgi:hypothetical protein